MGDYVTILLLLSMSGIVLAIIGICKGSIKLLNIHGRKNSTYLLITSLVLFIISGMLWPNDKSKIAPQTNSLLKEAVVYNYL